MIIAGDSVGGGLALSLLLRLRDEGSPLPAGAVLLCPAPDLTLSLDDFDLKDPVLRTVGDFWQGCVEGYCAGHPPDDPLVSPLFGDLSGLPPALVLTAEFDPLRDEGEAYAKRLEQAGVPVTVKRYDGHIHGFFGMVGQIDAAEAAQDEVAGQLRLALA